MVTVLYHWLSDPEGIRHAIVPMTQVSMFLSLWWAVKKLKMDAVGYTYHLCNIFIITSIISLPPAIYAYFHSRLAVGPLLIEQYAGGTNQYRLIGWYGSPNRLAPVLAIGVISSWHLLTNKRQFRLGQTAQRIVFACLIADACGVILTGCRSVILALACAGTVYLLFEERPASRKIDLWIKKLLLVTLVVATVSSLFVYIGFDIHFVGDRILRVTGDTASLRTGNNRLILWERGLRLLNNASTVNLLIGHGSRHFMRETGGVSSHSGYITAAVEEGILYLGALVLFIGYCYVIAFRNRRRGNRYVVALSILTLLVIRNFFNVTLPHATFSGIAFLMSALVILTEDAQESGQCPPANTGKRHHAHGYKL